MPIYTCIRCNFETKRKSSFKKHLLRKNVCKPIHSDVSILEVIEYYKPKFNDIVDHLVFATEKDLEKTEKRLRKTENYTEKSTNIYCKYCKKTFTRTNNKNVHEKKYCKIKKELDEHKSITINNNNINNGTINNNNNINIMNFGSEELYDILPPKVQLQILNTRYGAIEKMVKIAHCDKVKYPQLQNIRITNLKGKYVEIFDAKTQNFVIEKKDVAIRTFIDNKYHDLSVMFEDYSHKMKEHDQRVIGQMIDDQSDEDYFFNYLKERMNILFYNYYKTMKTAG